jgi:hypothetical protein
MARHGDVSLWIELAPGDDEALKRLAGALVRPAGAA